MPISDVQAVVAVEEQQLKLEWAQDSAFRFFPLLRDERFGYRLHDADAAVNKLLALAGRDEVRDFVDVLRLHETYLSLGAMAWAACGKDPGFTPAFLLEQTARHTAYTQADLDRLELRRPLDLRTLKEHWCAALSAAKTLVTGLPAEDLGSLYLDRNQTPQTPDVSSAAFGSLSRHWGKPQGAWPVVSPYQ